MSGDAKASARTTAPMVARPLPTVDEVKARLNRLTQAFAKAKTIIGNEVYEVELRLKSLEQEARQQERSVNAIKAGNRLRTTGTDELATAASAASSADAATADVDMISADGHAKSSVGGDGTAEGGGPSGGDVSALGTASTAEPAAEQTADGAIAGEGEVPKTASTPAELERVSTRESTTAVRGDKKGGATSEKEGGARLPRRVNLTDSTTEQRNRKMLGMLVGTLKRAREEVSALGSAQQHKLQAVDAKLRSDRTQMIEAARERTCAQLLTTKRRHEDLASELAELDARLRQVQKLLDQADLAPRMRTETAPPLYYLPKRHNEATRTRLRQQQQATMGPLLEQLAALEAMPARHRLPTAADAPFERHGERAGAGGATAALTTADAPMAAVAEPPTESVAEARALDSAATPAAVVAAAVNSAREIAREIAEDANVAMGMDQHDEPLSSVLDQTAVEAS
jgi:hypothetical protein